MSSGPDVRPDVSWRTVSLEIADCERVEFLTATGDDVGHRFDGWPRDVKDAFERATKAWQREHPECVIRAVTTAARGSNGQRSCVMILHFVRKPEQTASDQTSAAASSEKPAATEGGAPPAEPSPPAASCGG